MITGRRSLYNVSSLPATSYRPDKNREPDERVTATNNRYLFFLNELRKHLKLIRERERNVLFNNALNTFYLQLYGVRHMVKDHSDSEKGNPLSPHGLLLSINSKGSFICTIPQTG